ncbi:MAG: DUF98 domain-containing protein [Methanobacteriota archaeon]|nr:MAG: DUF98 domain-containing protein [Euryarchaeota archaeon]
MTAMSSADIQRAIQRLEQEIGTLSPVQKILLGTDGSVTNLLEMITGSPVAITTLAQSVVPADEESAAALGISSGEEVNHRVVQITNSQTGKVLIYAISNTPLSRLSPSFTFDLMKADIPIGKILQKHRIEARREIAHLRLLRADETLSTVFGIFEHEPLISRQYQIIHRKKPLISIEEIFPKSNFASESCIFVDAPSRLHVALIDMSGSLGRVDGGIGITIDEPRTVIEVRRSNRLEVRGCGEEMAERVRTAAKATLHHLGLPEGAEIILHSMTGQHKGLGSGTSVALSVASALCRLNGQSLTTAELALVTGRGGTSGIGTAAFETGGFILDGGHSFGGNCAKREFKPSSASVGVLPPRVSARHPFPYDWQILLVTPRSLEGASRNQEVDIFKEHCPVPLSEVREICHEIVVRMLPGLMEHDLDLFGAAVNRIQHLGFKRIEIERQSMIVPSLIQGLLEAGAACAGMSSFGPTVYAISDGDMRTIEKAAHDMIRKSGGDVIITRGRNIGAQLRAE